MAIDLSLARRLAFSVVLGQAAVTLVSPCWLADRGPVGGVLGGAGRRISTVASLAMAMLGFAPATQEPQRAMRAFFVGERQDPVVIVLFVWC